MIIKNKKKIMYILIPFVYSSAYSGDFFEPSGTEHDYSHHHHVEDHYQHNLEEKKHYESIEKESKKNTKPTEAEKEKSQDSTEQEHNSSIGKKRGSLELPDHDTSTQDSTLKKNVEAAKKSTISQTFDSLLDYFAKPFTKDLKKLIAVSIVRALKTLLLDLLGVYHNIQHTTAPLDMLKVKAELATEKKEATHEADNIQDAIDAITNLNTFLLNNEQYTFSSSMQNTIKTSTSLSKKVGRILKMTNSPSSPTDTNYLDQTKNIYNPLITKVENLQATSSSLPEKILGATGLVDAFHNKWQFFETTESSSNAAAITYATSITLTGLLQSSYILTQFVMSQSSSSTTLHHPVDDLSDDYFEELLETLITTS